MENTEKLFGMVSARLKKITRARFDEETFLFLERRDHRMAQVDIPVLLKATGVLLTVL